VASDLTQSQKLYFQIINDLHREWKPHDGQLKVGQKYFNEGISTLFIQCGRKWGKTEFAIYMLWRHALLNPGAACYYVTPEMTHGRKLVWTDPRLSTFGNNKYVKSVNSNEMIVRFKNGSFIQILGSENYSAANGLRPSFLVYDEFCEFHPSFHETMNPNRAVRDCPLMLIGTPPRMDSRNKEQYITYADECEKSPKAMWISQNSYSNPHIDKKWLDEEKQRLFDRGEEWLWYSQYMAQITAGGKHVIFPMLNEMRHVRTHADIINEIKRDAHKLEWYCVSDPGTTTVMAFLFAAVNPYNKKIYILDEIYEKKPSETSVQRVMPRVIKKADDLCGKIDFNDDWYKTYDEAAAWFCNEVAQQYGIYFQPTLKMHNKKENGISLIKDILIHGVIDISDRCPKLLWEMQNYVATEDGKFPKINDHLIDCFRYFLASAHYSMVEVMEAVRTLGSRRLDQEDPHGYQHKSMSRDKLDELDWTDLYD
jgi:hypothetical protein